MYSRKNMQDAFRFLSGIFIISISAFAQTMDHPQQRWNYFYEQRRYPHDKIPDGARLNAVQAVRAMAAKTDGAKSVIRAVPQTQWQFIGPSPIDFGNGYVEFATASPPSPSIRAAIIRSTPEPLKAASGKLRAAASSGLRSPTIRPLSPSAHWRSIRLIPTRYMPAPVRRTSRRTATPGRRHSKIH